MPGLSLYFILIFRLDLNYAHVNASCGSPPEAEEILEVEFRVTAARRGAQVPLPLSSPALGFEIGPYISPGFPGTHSNPRASES